VTVFYVFKEKKRNKTTANKEQMIAWINNWANERSK